MSDHAWAQEHVAAAAAGGLTAAEAERLDAHARDCPECAAALAEARALDGRLVALFADARPGAVLEERVVRALRSERLPVLRGGLRKLAVGVAASVGLAVVGAGASRLGGMDALPLPGEVVSGEWFRASSSESKNSLKQTGLALARDPEAMAEAFGERARFSPDGRTPADTKGYVADRVSNSATSNAGQMPPALNVYPQDATKDGTFFYHLSPAIDEVTPGKDADAAGKNKANVATGPLRGYGLASDMYAVRPQSDSNAGNSAKYAPPPATPSDSSTSTGKSTWALQYGLGFTNGTVLDYYKVPPGGEKEPATPREPRKAEAQDRPPASTPPPPPAKPAAPTEAKPEPAPAAGRRVVIRSGELEFEVESFDTAVAAVTKLVNAVDGAYVATVNSDKLANGKVKGSVVVRVPPAALDGLVAGIRRDLARGGELKGQRVGSQDITKQYTDLESRLKAARTMEARLLQIIKEGKGEIKQLLEAEKELGVWRTRVEEIEGELRYYGNLVSLSTLTVTIAERELRTAAALAECERVQAGVEVDDVDAALRQALAAVAEVKGRVTKSELKQQAAGQFNATIHFEVAPDASGPTRDRLRQIGRVARLEIDRVQEARGGAAPRDVRDLKVTRGDAQFFVQFYNLADGAPRETATLQVAAPDVPVAYRALRDAVVKAGGRVLASRLDEQDRQNVTGQIDFEARRADEPAVQAALAASGEAVARNVARAPEGPNLTDAKVLYRVALVSAAKLKPRETTTLAVEVPDVDAATAVFAAQVAEAKGRVADAQVAHERGGRVTARLVYEVPLASAAGVVERFKAAGAVRLQQSSRDPQAPDGRYATARVDVTLSNADPIVGEGAGVWPQVRRGLSYSAAVLLTSVTWVVFGLCVVLPWAVVGYAGYRLVRRLSRPAPEPAPPAAGA